MLQFMTLCLLLSYAIAAPFLSDRGTHLAARDVFDPPILVPNSKTVWKSGQTVTVTWNTTDMPPDSQLTNPNGTLLLGFLTADSENLMVDSPLAQGFKLHLGKINITVPNVPTRHNYIVVLMGSSGNASPEFTILGGKITSSSTSTSSSAPPSSSSSASATLTTSSSSDTSGASTSAPSTTPVAANTSSSTTQATTTTVPSAGHTLRSSGMISFGSLLLVVLLNA